MASPSVQTPSKPKQASSLRASQASVTSKKKATPSVRESSPDPVKKSTATHQPLVQQAAAQLSSPSPQRNRSQSPNSPSPIHFHSSPHQAALSHEQQFRQIAEVLLADRNVSPDDAIEGPPLEGVTTIRFQTGSRSPSYGKSLSPGPGSKPWWVERSPDSGNVKSNSNQARSKPNGQLDTTFGEPPEYNHMGNKQNEAEMLLYDLNRLIAQKHHQ